MKRGAVYLSPDTNKCEHPERGPVVIIILSPLRVTNNKASDLSTAINGCQP